jgi:hypothetical protein
VSGTGNCVFLSLAKSTNGQKQSNLLDLVVCSGKNTVMEEQCPLLPGNKMVGDSAVGRGTVLQTGRSRVRFPIRALGFFIHFILPAALRST